MNKKTLSAALFIIVLQSCSTANWYQSAKSRGEIECRKLPDAQYDECMHNYETTYEQYRQQREEAIKQ